MRKKISIKVLSVNQAWCGRRFKTPKYKAYEKELWYLLPNKNIPKGKLALDIVVGHSNKGADIDNFLKPFLDVLQKKYIFNDNRIFKLVVEKKIVKKGEEYISFNFTEYFEPFEIDDKYYSK
jgi:Holliday junction resolvase RusA-like endonuclease